MRFDDGITKIKGVGPKSEKLFKALDIDCVGALIYDFPRTYQLYPKPIKKLSGNEGKKVAVRTSLRTNVVVRHTSKMDISTTGCVIGDERLEMIWFRMPYLKSSIKVRTEYVFYGELKAVRENVWQLVQPVVFKPLEYDKLERSPQAVYSLTKGLTNKAIKKAMALCLDDIELTEEYLPADILKKRELWGYHRAMDQMHRPDDMESLTNARRRLVYDEFLKFFITKEMEGAGISAIPNRWSFPETVQYEKVLSNLPFPLTTGQKDTLEDIKKDFSSEVVSQRLLQGDVGSGKTIIAFLAMLMAVENGFQAAIMAPTEVLCRQHERTFADYIKMFDLPYDVICITGSDKGAKRKKLNERAANEGGLFIVGTHALLSDNMNYHSLAVVVTDEQHRFGVKQRKILSQKGQDPHVIVMSATPIPRTLAMILYSDMKISVIKDVPTSRLRTKNAIITKNQRSKAYDFIKKEVSGKHQAYIICPLVEASEKTEAENVTEYAGALEKYYGGEIKIGMLHGRMSPEQKDEVVGDFAEGRTDVLVSTTVVEVGVNVPNATVMLIEDANRFGLAQLHQLRGRVGRGQWQSFCMFVDASEDEESSERLKILAQSNDGFFIASEDLRLRGPGDFYGIRQSGDMDFKLADIYQDADVMREASADAKEITAADPQLKSEESRKIAGYLKKMDTVVYSNL